MSIFPACMYMHMCMRVAWRDQRRVQDLLKLELWKAVSQYVGDGKQPRSSVRAARVLNLQAISLAILTVLGHQMSISRMWTLVFSQNHSLWPPSYSILTWPFPCTFIALLFLPLLTKHQPYCICLQCLWPPLVWITFLEMPSPNMVI